MKKLKKEKINKYKPQNSDESFIPEDILDCHEFGQIPYFEIVKLIEEFIEDSFNNEFYKVRIITGKGKIIRPLTINILKKSEYVENFNFSDYWSGQD